uniref:Uncharacterized protein n=1 Tax=Anopheles arabiensis TaxID=7173 RepID=A0A182HJF8_ANOAR
MADSFFKAVIRDPKWDVRSEAKRLGFLFQLYIDSKKPTEVFIKYKTAKEAAKARASLAQNENVLRVESMDEWNIKPKKQESKQPEHNASAAPSVVGSTVQTRSPAKHNSAASNHMPPPMPMQMPMQMQMPMGPPGMFSVCAACRNSGASFQCFVCGIFYCGDQCQRADWPAHIMQCVPRLVRATNPFVAANVPQRSMPLPFNGMFPGAGNNIWYENKENAQHYAPPHSNGPVAGSSKQQAGTSKQQPGTSKQQAQQPKPVPTATPKESPPCSVPTNVLKSMAMKRHQDQADPSNSVVSGESSAPAKANEAKPAKEGSKLAKRVQQKTAPKRTIQYATFPLEGENVKISYVSAGGELYVYRTGPEANGQPNRYIELVKRSIECARGVKEMVQAAPKVEDVVFAPFDGDYYRAAVKSVDGSQVSVFFPDFGNSLTVEWKQLKDIPDKDIQYGTCYTHAVKIEGVPTPYTPMVYQFLCTLQELDDFELTKVEDGAGGKTIDMRHVRELYQLSEKVREVGNKEKMDEKAKKAAVKQEAVPKMPIPDPASYLPVTADDIIEHDMQMGPDVELMIVEASELDGLNQLTVILKSDSLEFANMLNECEQRGAADPNPYQPEEENLVFLLQFEGIWCRALLASSQDEEKQYYLLDLGIIRTLSEQPECRRYPAGLTRKMFACECIVDNPEMLRVTNATEDNNVALRGMMLKATVYQHTEEENETTHIKILSIRG